MNDVDRAEQNKPSEILSTMPELIRKVAAITGVTADENRKLLTSSDQRTVAKFSSFRQAKVSTINEFLAVTAVTVRRDADQ
jgi:hypothetical protein